MRILILIILLFLFGNTSSYAQCTTPGQTPSTAFPVCGVSTFTQSNVPSCGGRPIPGPCGLSLTDVNPFYYKFTCYIAGTLGFVISPFSAADDYDWQVFDITNRNPNDIYSDPSLFVACNWSGIAGTTGAIPSGTGLVHCSGNVPLNSAMPTLIVGHEYLLMVSNWSNSQQGYNLNFTGGTASITDPLQPTVSSASVNCESTAVTIRFNKKMRCNSLAANGSDFVINPGGIVVSASSINCAGGFDMDSAVVTISNILPAGNYTISIANGTDGNSIMDVCGEPIPAGVNLPFTVEPKVNLPMGVITQPSCQPPVLTMTFPEPIRCNTISANGSEFTITGPSSATITGTASPTCTNGETTIITITLSAPLTVPGTYQLHVTTGTDGNSFLGSCNRQVVPGSIAQFTLPPPADLPMGTIPQPTCAPNFIDLQLPQPIHCNSVAPNGSDFQIAGASTVTITGATPNSCNGNNMTNSIRINFSGPILTTGDYNLSVVSGTDGNSLLGACGVIPVASTATFNLPPQAPIAMGNILDPGCTPAFIDLELPELIYCNSIAANGSDFSVSGPSAVSVTGAVPNNCDGNNQTRSIRITFAAPIVTSGNYSLEVVNGADGNTLVGTCGRIIPASSASIFSITPQAPIPIGTIPTQPCAPTTVTITFADSILCSSISPDGSDFSVTGNSAVTIISAAGTCSPTGKTTSITLTYSAPISVDGTYTVVVNNGSDGNTLIGNCNRMVSQGSNVSFEIPATAAATVSDFSINNCSPTSLTINFDLPIQCSSISADASEFAISGPSNVMIASAIGTCNANGLTTSVTLQFASPIVVGGDYQFQISQGTDGNSLLNECYRQLLPGSGNFTLSDTVSAEFSHTIEYDCEIDEVTFTHDGANNVNQWTWLVNGVPSGNASVLTQQFPASSTNEIQLTVANEFCTATYSANLVLNNKVVIDFEVPENLCPGDSVQFINNSTGLVEVWEWNFGNGNLSDLEIPGMQAYPNTGVQSEYNVTLSASNSLGCDVSQTKTITVLATCLIAVPSAFTPNNDGLNDFLFPLNALKADNLDFKVYNRWGDLVFHSKNWLQKWDGRVKGKEQATGVFVWTLNFTDRDTRVKHSMKGTTTLIR